MKQTIFIGYDEREKLAADVCAHSIRRRSHGDLEIKYLKHKPLRKAGLFNREWKVCGDNGQTIDALDGKPFSTEFSHTRFLVPELMHFGGWALFMDCDMIFTSNAAKLFKLADPKYAVMCVKHKHQVVENSKKMDGRLQQNYYRKNWSSFVLWNCGHPANQGITRDVVNTADGSDMHRFFWLKDEEIGELPFSYNYISGVSPLLGTYIDKNGKQKPVLPDVIHYTEGGPWFDNYKNVPFGDLWEIEYRSWREDGELGGEVA